MNPEIHASCRHTLISDIGWHIVVLGTVCKPMTGLAATWVGRALERRTQVRQEPVGTLRQPGESNSSQLCKALVTECTCLCPLGRGAPEILTGDRLKIEARPSGQSQKVIET
jgi:hypothetical protein